ncbi:MAG: hypothetical protein SWK90_13095 [Chloroflexota bacterium]|nr:hypothetical protein [Chloroflexota bacterium]
MPTSLETERDDFDLWIGRVLAGGMENVRPPEQVWTRIVHQMANSVGTERATTLDVEEESYPHVELAC